MEIGDFVVVTTGTDRRDIFGGILKSHDEDNARVTLTDARNCVHWSTETRGVVGLANKGPQDGSRIGPATTELKLNGVTTVMAGTDEARQAWEAEPWN